MELCLIAWCIVESGRDKFYACSLSFMNKDIFKKQSHSGKNKLGEYLMQKRTVLRQQIA